MAVLSRLRIEDTGPKIVLFPEQKRTYMEALEWLELPLMKPLENEKIWAIPPKRKKTSVSKRRT
jgi:hypothetical protein